MYHAITHKKIDIVFPMQDIRPRNVRGFDIEKLCKRVIVSVTAVNIVFGAYLMHKLSLPNVILPTANAEGITKPTHTTQIGHATDQLIQNLKSTGLNPVVQQDVKSRYFSVEGKLVTLEDDNLQVFEYGDSVTASKEAETLKQRYEDSSRTKRAKEKYHLYTNENVAIFYIGNNTKIIDSLNQAPGVAVVEPSVQLGRK